MCDLLLKVVTCGITPHPPDNMKLRKAGPGAANPPRCPAVDPRPPRDSAAATSASAPVRCALTRAPPAAQTAFTAADIVPTRHFDSTLAAVHALQARRPLRPCPRRRVHSGNLSHCISRALWSGACCSLAALLPPRGEQGRKTRETCPISTEGWTRRVHFVREGGVGGGGGARSGRAASARAGAHARCASGQREGVRVFAMETAEGAACYSAVAFPRGCALVLGNEVSRAREPPRPARPGLTRGRGERCRAFLRT